jgi:hypothetical protein
MSSENRAFMGIDLTNQRSYFTCAVLDSSRQITFCGTISPLEWQSLLSKNLDTLAAINSPLTLNGGFMADPDYRITLTPVPPKSRFTNLRVCEYQLLNQGISTSRTSADVSRFSPALQRAFQFTSDLGLNGFQFWPSANSRYQMVETQADAAFQSMLGIKPFTGSSLEGRIQRQLLLQNKGIAVPDAMGFFEEITRFRLLSGKLPDEKILPLPSLNALVAAYTAWVVLNRPSDYIRFGEPNESILYIPVTAKPE